MILRVGTDHGEIAVHLAGRDPARAPGILLLHANPGDHRDFAEISAVLGRRWAIAAVDWPGYGQSGVRDPAAVTVPALVAVAETVCAVLASHGFRELIVVGSSVGGYVALRLAHRADVVGVVAVAPAGFAPLNVATRLLFRIMSGPRTGPALVAPSARAYLGPARGGGARAIYERAVALGDDPARLAVYRSIWAALADPGLELRAGDRPWTEVPVQVVWGRNDPINPWAVSRKGVAEVLPHAEVAILPARHEPYAECPQRFLDAVTPFLTRHAASSA
ncbi:alpha/beta fold hydrolase [Nocardia sp. NPDC057227]|uniref:alpha/beta fold hydrolase n=1 Tax=Nocardia sp. NPDC057227 TaxID=3346056 RepID=UPI00362F66B6